MNISKIRTQKSNAFEMAKRVSAQDTALRNEYIGQPEDEFAEYANSAFKSHGIELSHRDIKQYVRSLMSGNDYRFVIAY